MAPCGDWGSDQCTGGTPSASSQSSPHVAAEAFADDSDDGWASDADDTQWIQYQFASGKQIQKLTIYNADSSFNDWAPGCWDRAPSGFQLLASNTGTFGGEEVTLLTVTEPIYSPWTDYNENRSWTFYNASTYTYYRIYIDDKQGDFGKGYEFVIDEIEMFECQD